MADSVLDCPVPIQQVDTEFLPLLEEYKRLSPKKNILEIGAYNGGTYWYWLKYAEPESNIVLIDNTITYDKSKQWSEWTRSDDNKDKNVSLTLLNMDSDDSRVFDTLRGIMFDFIFVDGGHSYEVSKKDYENFYPMLRKDGIISFHDINNAGYPAFGVKKLWGEIKRIGIGYREIITMLEQVGGIGIIYK
jgi:predicted O-methyltransferase YrrM